MPIPAPMHPSDRYDGADQFDDELPELPIPRPGDQPERAAASAPTPIQPPRLGGGASYTSVDPDAPHEEQPEPNAPLLTAADRERVEAERFTWELAARLTAGMLANPAKMQTSVKDAMAMFDQFLQEMHAYTRIASEFEVLHQAAEEQRRQNEAYFHAQREAGTEQASTPSVSTNQPARGATPVAITKPEPAKPRPADGYTPIPPGLRYVPGSMAGNAPFEASGDAEEDVA